MTMRQLAIFRTVCEELSFTGAAAKLYMTQPAVSHIIGELEEETGLKLFDRLGRKIYLSGEGELFLQKAARLLELYGELKNAGEDIARRAPLKIGSSITIANFWLPPVLKRFYRNFSDAPVRVKVESAAKVTQLLEKNQIDLALVEGTVKRADFLSTAFSSYRVCAYCACDYPLPSVPISLPALAGERLLLREKGSAVRDVLDSALTLADMSVEPCFISVNSQALIRAAQGGLGIAFLPDILVRGEIKDGSLREVPVEGLALRNENHVVLHRDKVLSEPLKEFLKYVLEGGAEVF